MAGVNVIAAETDREARRLFKSAQQQFTNLVAVNLAVFARRSMTLTLTGAQRKPYKLPARSEYSFVGSETTVRSGLQAFVKSTGVGELMGLFQQSTSTRRTCSYELLANVTSMTHS